LVLFALFLVVLLGASALTVDYSSWLLSRRSYQNVSDAAALAGVAQLTRPHADPCVTGKTKAVCAREAAWTSVKQQLGLSALVPGTRALTDTPQATPYSEAGYRVWVDTPPSAAGTKYAGAYASNSGVIFVRVEKDNLSLFGRIFGQRDPTISAWSTAGLNPNRYAIIALCPKSTKTTDCSQAQDLTMTGGSGVKVIGGDVGSNWGLTVTSGSGPGITIGGDSQVYLVATTCGPSSFSCPPAVSGGISDGGSPATAKAALPLPIPVADPGYALPSWIDDSTAVPNRPDFNANSTGDPVNPTASNVTCAAGSTRLGPGSYSKIIVKKGCVILDPTYGLTAGQRPGVFRIKDSFQAANGAFMIGDGVSIFLDSTIKSFSVGNGGALVINTGNATANEFKAAWTTRGAATWSLCAALPCTPTYNISADGIGMAFYVRPPTPDPLNPLLSTSIFNMSGSSGLAFRGVLYGPRDVIGVGGNSGQASAGQIVGWTIKYNGGTTITQTYEGAADERPFLLEPTLGQ